MQVSEEFRTIALISTITVCGIGFLFLVLRELYVCDKSYEHASALRLCDWQLEYVCSTCRKPLIRDQVLHSSGCCPKCGVIHGGSIVPYFAKSRRWVWDEPPKDSFWRTVLGLKTPGKGHWEYKVDGTP